MSRRAKAAAGALVLALALVPGIAPSAAQESGSGEPDAGVPEVLAEAEAQQSGLQVLPRWYFHRVARFGDVRLVCPAVVVEGDLIRCFVAEYTLVGQVYLTVVRLWELFRLPTPVVTASATAPSVPPELLARRFESAGYAVENRGFWSVFVQTVDDDVCDPQPYSLALDVTAGVFDLDATVTVLDDGDPPPAETPGAECAPPVDVSVFDASAVEDDEELVFALEVTGAAPQADVSVDYALASGSAVAGADYSDVSGTLTIPAGTRHATVTVPLVDDAAAEGTESFSLRLSNPAGMILARTSASGTISDDDSDTTASLPAVPQCERPVLRGSVAGVFDIAQARYSRGSHAFVDVDVTCGGEGSPVGLPVALSVVEGPAGSLGPSGHCVAQAAGRTVVGSASAAAGCATFAVRRPVSGVDDGRSTHLLRIPDASIGQPHQLLAWIDTDRDGAHDRGEPYQYVAADFVGRSVGGATLLDFGLPDDFAVELVSEGSDRIARSGFDSELLLRLSSVTAVPRAGGEPVSVTAPLANALVGASVSAGPSAGTAVMCLSTSGTERQCRTDADGKIILRYRVGSDTTSVLRRTQDVLAVFHDPDQDGRRAFGASTSFVAHPIAKTVNYVALGDSYSAGEAGATPPTGAYQTGVSGADADCKRWDRAFPYVFSRDWLNIPHPQGSADDMFRTFACVGAITLNVHDARVPGSDLSEDDIEGTNRPSHAVPRRSDVDEVPSGQSPRPERRQAVSLGEFRAERLEGMGDVDMVTITVGGNDAGFASVLRECVLGGRDCRPAHLPNEYRDIPARLSSVLREIKRVAPNASIFVLGYPYITPQPVEANRGEIERCGASNRPLHATGIRVNAISGLLHFVLLGTESDAAISFSEAEFLWNVASDLNQKLRDAATEAGVHFVDISGRTTGDRGPIGFRGHSPCSAEPYINGFVSVVNQLPPIDPSSFHPNEAGHLAYADILAAYIRKLDDLGVPLNESGVPVNPGSMQ